MRVQLPEAYPSGTCVLVPIDTGLVPLISGVLAQMLAAHRWKAGEYENGYRAITEVIAAMTSLCAQQLVQEIRDLRGVMPAYASTPVDERTSAMYNSLNDLNQWLLDMRGIMSDGWFTDTYTTLKDVVQVQRGTDQSTAASIWGVVREALLAGSSGASIIDIIAGFLEEQESTAVQGGLLASLLAVTAANAGIVQAMGISILDMQGRLNDVLLALRGATAPDDNILLALRGGLDVSAGLSIAEQLT